MTSLTRALPLLTTALLLGACAGESEPSPPETTTMQVTATETVTETPPTTTVTTTETVTDTPVAAPVRADCSADAFRIDFTEPVVMFCDGAWARAGQAQTDHLIVYRAAAGQWRTYEPHGTTYTGYPCFDEATVTADGAPAGLLQQLTLCGG
ncbi:MAG TPA: hypothetical protein K8V93_09240 [Corynebacterium pollutisoli]|nr:hypothetical protein [Corynebacterium pollutisoli]